MLLKEPQRLWALQSCTRIPNCDTEHQQLPSNRTFLTRSSLLAEPGNPWSCETWDVAYGGTSTNPAQLHNGSQDVFWRNFYLDPAFWWDCGHKTKAVHVPHFGHARVSKALWLKNVSKSAWTQLDLVAKELTLAEPSLPSPGLRWSRDEGDITIEAFSRLCKKGPVVKAVQLLDNLVRSGSRVRISVFYTLIRRCVVLKNFVLGRRVHSLVIESGHESNTFLSNHILRMYASQGKLQEAMYVFTRVGAPDVFMWSSIISAHSEHGDPLHAIQLYHQLRYSGVKPDSHVFVAALKACACALDWKSGLQVHADMLESGVETNAFVGSCLVDMYAKCGRLRDARRVFDSLPARNVVTWTAMIGGYAEHGLGQDALALYEGMKHEGITASDSAIFACLLKACASIGAIEEGRQLHSQILDRGLETNTVIANCLVDMYAKCGNVQDARKVFDNLATRDVVSWNSMINAYTENGLGHEALTLYAQMEREGEGRMPANNITYACLLKACASIGALKQGERLHSQIVERGLEADLVVANCLVDMFAKCGTLKLAREVFDSLPRKNVVTWTSLITGYAVHGHGREALALYGTVEEEGMIIADNVTFACLLKACENIGALQEGRQLHTRILDRGLETDVVVGSSLVDMYAKCGCLEDACRVFEKLPIKNVITWTALVDGLGQSNKGQQAIKCFEKMLSYGVQPNETAFTCLLVACSHDGLVNEGQQYFSRMTEKHGIVPTRQHYVCMVDLLGRAGRVDEAEKLLMSMPFERGIVEWTSLLTSCRTHGCMECGRRCFEALIQLDPQSATAYVLMANIYANAGRWTDVDNIESLRMAAGAMKKPGQAGIEVNRQVHIFTVGDKRNDVSLKSWSMGVRLKEGGHIPRTELVLKPSYETDKEDELCGHAEKLALAYGLLNTSDGTTLLVTKNLRMCGDCHTATQVMSRIERREIIVRDAHRIHRFVAGSCSCGDRP